jgi:hypothetical protein
MAQTLVALIVWLCLAVPAAAAQSKADTKKPARPAWSEPAEQQRSSPAGARVGLDGRGAAQNWLTIADRYPR